MDEGISAVVKTSNFSSILVSVGIFMAGIAALIVAGSFAGFVVYHFSPGNKDQLIETPQSDSQLIQLGQFRRDQFLVDRRNGRVWTLICFGKVSGPDCDGMQLWQEMYVDNATLDDSRAANAYRTHVNAKTGRKQTKP